MGSEAPAERSGALSRQTRRKGEKRTSREGREGERTHPLISCAGWFSCPARRLACAAPAAIAGRGATCRAFMYYWKRRKSMNSATYNRIVSHSHSERLFENEERKRMRVEKNDTDLILEPLPLSILLHLPLHRLATRPRLVEPLPLLHLHPDRLQILGRSDHIMPPSRFSFPAAGSAFLRSSCGDIWTNSSHYIRLACRALQLDLSMPRVATC